MSERKFNQTVANKRRWRIATVGAPPGDLAFLRLATRNRARSKQLGVALESLRAEKGLTAADINAADDDTAIVAAATPLDAELVRRRVPVLLRQLAHAAPWLRKIEVQVKNDGR